MALYAKEEKYPLMTLEEVLEGEEGDIEENYKEFVNPYLVKMLGLIGFNKSFVRAEGTKVWDNTGKQYVDFLGGYGALNLGHNPRAILEAIKKIMDRPNILQAALNPIAAALAKNIAAITPGELRMTFFSNSGAEAVEGAIKTARAATGRKKLLYCEGSFHGKTLGALSITGREKYRTPFQPLLEDVFHVSFGDMESLKNALAGEAVAAFILEPIQGEGGIIVPPEGYLQQARTLCDRSGTLLIVDEVQTGFGRTGKLFACEHENIVPDILCLAKSLGGGVIPIGATVAKESVWNRAYGSMEKCLLHTSTFGGNSMAAAAGMAALQEIYEQGLVEQSNQKGKYFIDRLKNLQKEYPIIKDVRGKGLMIGLEFHTMGGIFKKLSEEYVGALVAGELLNRYGLITAYTLNNPNVIRLEPPLIITYEEIDYMVDALEAICKRHKNFFSLALGGSKKMIGRFIRG